MGFLKKACISIHIHTSSPYAQTRTETNTAIYQESYIHTNTLVDTCIPLIPATPCFPIPPIPISIYLPI